MAHINDTALYAMIAIMVGAVAAAIYFGMNSRKPPVSPNEGGATCFTCGTNTIDNDKGECIVDPELEATLSSGGSCNKGLPIIPTSIGIGVGAVLLVMATNAASGGRGKSMAGKFAGGVGTIGAAGMRSAASAVAYPFSKIAQSGNGQGLGGYVKSHLPTWGSAAPAEAASA